MVERTQEELLMALLAGDLSVDDPVVSAMARSDEAFRRQVEDLENLAGELHRAGDLERGILSEASRLEGTSLTSKGLLDALERELETGSATATRSWGRWLAAAIFLVVAGLAWRAWIPGAGGSETQAPRYLGHGEAVSPKGEVSNFEAFTWDLNRTPDGWFEVIVEDGEGQRELARSGELSDPRWEPTLEQREAFGQAIRWRVLARSAQAGTEEALAEAWLKGSRD